MELIKLPLHIGLLVTNYLKKRNIAPRKVETGPYKGMLNLEFTQEELDLVTEIDIVNPVKGCLDGIENLRCLERLHITTQGATAYKKSPASITDKDILKISKLKSLKSLKIDNQANISWVYLEHLENLEEVQITRNTSLEEIFGLNKLQKLREFVEFGNKELFTLECIGEMIANNALDIFEIDFLHFNEVCDFYDKLSKLINCDFTESLSGKTTTISYTFYQMLLFHKKCLEIAAEAQKISQDRRLQIIYVENYLAKNITYDYEALNTEKRAHYHEGKQQGKRNGTNSAYNGIMYGSAVCEGYTRTMQYILKLMGIKSKNVYCISGRDQISINHSYHNQVTLPDDGYHSIVRVEIDNSIYYCDPCWDSCRYHRGDTSLPYCLLTKKEISQSHTLSFEEDDVIYDISYPRNHVSTAIEYMKKVENSTPTEKKKPKK